MSRLTVVNVVIIVIVVIIGVRPSTGPMRPAVAFLSRHFVLLLGRLQPLFEGVRAKSAHLVR